MDDDDEGVTDGNQAVLMKGSYHHGNSTSGDRGFPQQLRTVVQIPYSTQNSIQYNTQPVL